MTAIDTSARRARTLPKRRTATINRLHAALNGDPNQIESQIETLPYIGNQETRAEILTDVFDKIADELVSIADAIMKMSALIDKTANALARGLEERAAIDQRNNQRKATKARKVKQKRKARLTS